MPGVQAAILAASKLDADLKNEPRPTGRVLDLPLTETFDRFREILSLDKSVKTVSEITKDVIDATDNETNSNLQIMTRSSSAKKGKKKDLIKEQETAEEPFLDINNESDNEESDAEDQEEIVPRRRMVRRRSDVYAHFRAKEDKKVDGELGDINKKNSMEDITANSSRTILRMNSPPSSPERPPSPGENSFNTVVNMTAPYTYRGYKYVQRHLSRPIPVKPNQDSLNLPIKISPQNSFNQDFRPPSPGENSFASLSHWISGKDTTVQKY